MYSTTKSIFFLFLFSFPLVLSAQVKSSNGQTFFVNETSEVSIQFLQIRVSMDNGIEKIKLLSSDVQRGRLKKEIDISLHRQSAQANYILSIIDDRGNVVLEKIMANPLSQSVEYVDEDTALLQRKEISFDQKDFQIRFPYATNNSFLKFEKLDNSNAGNNQSKRTTLANIPLN